MKDLLFIATAGALGSLSRYGVGLLSERWWGRHAPYGTFVVNIAGCFLLGFIMTLALSNDAFPRHYRLALTTGFLGAFTTFSTVGYETMTFVEHSAWKLAALNVAANLFVGLLAAAGGIALAKLLLAR